MSKCFSWTTNFSIRNINPLFNNILLVLSLLWDYNKHSRSLDIHKKLHVPCWKGLKTRKPRMFVSKETTVLCSTCSRIHLLFFNWNDGFYDVSRWQLNTWSNNNSKNLCDITYILNRGSLRSQATFLKIFLRNLIKFIGMIR